MINKLLTEFTENAEKLVAEKWANELNEKGELVIKGFGSFKVLPRRVGEVNGFGKTGKILYQKRIKFTVSRVLKEKVCK
jgi:nucleoid DNA-binding protein